MEHLTEQVLELLDSQAARPITRRFEDGEAQDYYAGNDDNLALDEDAIRLAQVFALQDIAKSLGAIALLLARRDPDIWDDWRNY